MHDADKHVGAADLTSSSALQRSAELEARHHLGTEI